MEIIKLYAYNNKKILKKKNVTFLINPLTNFITTCHNISPLKSKEFKVIQKHNKFKGISERVDVLFLNSYFSWKQLVNFISETSTINFRSSDCGRKFVLYIKLFKLFLLECQYLNIFSKKHETNLRRQIEIFNIKLVLTATSSQHLEIGWWRIP